MAIGSIGGPDPSAIRHLDSLVARAGTGMAAAQQGAEAQRREASDEVSLSGTPVLDEQPASAPSPPPAEYRSCVPVVMLDEMAEPEILDGGTKLDKAQHLQLMAEAASKGTQTVTVQGPSGVAREINVHGASEKELRTITRSLTNLAAVDAHDLILHDVKDIYLADNLGTGHGGHPVAGVAVKMDGEYETAITLSRMVGQTTSNPLESQLKVDDVLYHEIGHVVDNRHNLSGRNGSPYGKGDAARIGAGGDFVSSYASTSHREDYAESFSDFYLTRASPSCRGLSDSDVVDLTLFAHGDKGQAVEKLRRVPRDLSPELHVSTYFGAFTEKHRDQGLRHGEWIERFYDDQKFRTSFVDDCVQQYPGVPREAVYDYMKTMASVFQVEI